ncbi:MAG: hypothetical protein AAF429_15515 [Pseudomonadota bacterium]
MDILFRRDQFAKSSGRIIFKLWSQIDVSEEEQKIIDKYMFKNAVVIFADQPGLIRRSIIAGILSMFGFAFVVSIFMGITGAMRHQVVNPSIMSFLPVLVGLIVGYVYFHQKRETIYVKDLLRGRSFKCNSVIDLVRKEAWLNSVVSFLRQVMESAKHWDGTEQHPVEVLPKDEARAFILKGL